MPWIICWQSSGQPGDRLAEAEDRRCEALAREINLAAEELIRWLYEDAEPSNDAVADAVRH
jgi:hypothetical protein